MTILVMEDSEKKQKLFENGTREIPNEEFESLKGRTIKNVKKLDGKIIFTVK
jgi:hypothetical protein